MRIVLTSQNRKEITGHAGMCRNFLVYDVENGQISARQQVSLPREQSFHETGGQLAASLNGTNVLISGGMGAGLKQRLSAGGIETIVTSETDPEKAVSAYLAGALSTADAQHLCGCGDGKHDEAQQHGHSHAPGACGCG